MNAELFKELMNTLIFLLPVVGIVWKGAKLAARLENLEATVAEKINKFCSDHKEMERKLEKEEKETETSINHLLTALNEIQKSVVRIETKLDMGEKKQ